MLKIITFFILQKLVNVLFPLAIIVPGKCVYILTFPYCKNPTHAKYPYRRFQLFPPVSISYSPFKSYLFSATAGLIDVIWVHKDAKPL